MTRRMQYKVKLHWETVANLRQALTAVLGRQPYDADMTKSVNHMVNTMSIKVFEEAQREAKAASTIAGRTSGKQQSLPGIDRNALADEASVDPQDGGGEAAPGESGEDLGIKGDTVDG